MKKLIIFDLDGTLAESKAAIDTEMADILTRLLQVARVAIISGGDWPQFEKQVLAHLPDKRWMKRLSILPTCGTKFYQFKKGWQPLYAENFTAEEKSTIINNLNAAVEQTGFKPRKTWGDQIEDRGSQVTFSALGQQAPLEQKKKWDPKFAKRKKIKKILNGTLSGFSVNMGGATSIDVTKPGIDKAYGIRKLKKVLDIKISQMIFIGDALFEGGNDYPARTTGADCIQVRDPEETKRVVDAITLCLDKK
ncbi:HAD-IIB family hydrolase [Mucilaginibacter mali]|uniref:phosphomannomutase n=1 Tax=Mucilaginibacter mali TaxID=2740462 RepID=A0A7D4TQB5_9SPHI|nr:HAD-IIB family hydrolase [Mucilaginibacter mali]QKJ31234.1 HAD-IIB family hydrolase [Mucilaginibacter mali]